MVENTPVLSAAEMYAKDIVFSVISFMAILAGVTPSESDKVRHSALASENLDLFFFRFVTIRAFDRQTDTRTGRLTDRQTKLFSSLDLVLFLCSAVKSNHKYIN